MKFNNMIFNISKNENKAYIDIYGEIGEFIDWNDFEVNAENTNIAFRNKLNDIDGVDEIIVNIDSLGGSVFHGVSIHDMLKSRKEKITVNIKGYTASIATIIAMSGDKINMSSNAMFLIHRASTGVYGNIDDMISVIEDLNTIDNSLIDIYHKRTGNKKSDILELMKEGNGYGKWINAKTAKKLGYVDEIIEPGKSEKIKNFKNCANSCQLPNIENDIDDDTLLKIIEKKIK